MGRTTFWSSGKLTGNQTLNNRVAARPAALHVEQRVCDVLDEVRPRLLPRIVLAEVVEDDLRDVDGLVSHERGELVGVAHLGLEQDEAGEVLAAVEAVGLRVRAVEERHRGAEPPREPQGPLAPVVEVQLDLAERRLDVSPQTDLQRWSGRRESNPHGSPHRHLRPARLPFPPRPDGV